MNEPMKARDLDGVTSPTALALFDDLCREFTAAYGALTDTAQHLIANAALLEQIIEQLKADIFDKGITEKVRNGRQTFTRENKSIDGLKKVMDQQRKILNELRLTPAGRKQEQKQQDAFEDF